MIFSDDVLEISVFDYMLTLIWAILKTLLYFW